MNNNSNDWQSACLTISYGQFISVLITGTGIFASLLASTKNNAMQPMFLASLNYFLLMVYFNGKRYLSGTIFKQTKNPWYWYAVVALLDVEANVAVTTAYNYTSITSIMLLDCFSIPCTMALSWYFLNAQYSNYHVYGVLICIVGLGLTVYSDILQAQDNSDDNTDANTTYAHSLYGDMLCLLGSVMYSCSNVYQEIMVKSSHRTEYLSHMGMFGFLVGSVQSFIFEYNSFLHIHYTPTVSLCIVGFVMCLFLMYCNASVFLKYGDAPLFNLSLLTSDVYAIVFAYFVYHYEVHWLYYIAFSITATGIIVYHNAGMSPTHALTLSNPSPHTNKDSRHTITLNITNNALYDTIASESHDELSYDSVIGTADDNDSILPRRI